MKDYYRKNIHKYKTIYYKYKKRDKRNAGCLSCGVLFQPTGANQKFCLSKKCQQDKKRLWNKKDRLNKLKKLGLPDHKECLICKQQFRFEKHKKFCSKTCYQISIRRIPKINFSKNCPTCKIQFLTKQSNQKYCTTNCGKSNKIGAKKRFEILKRDNFTCQYCGEKAPKVLLHVDHKKPKIKGGDNSDDNLITACELCNLGKSDIY